MKYIKKNGYEYGDRVYTVQELVENETSSDDRGVLESVDFSLNRTKATLARLVSILAERNILTPDDIKMILGMWETLEWASREEFEKERIR